MPSHQYKRWSVLTMNTLAFACNFAVWTMFSIIGIKIKQGSRCRIRSSACGWPRQFSLQFAHPACRWESLPTGTAARIVFFHPDAVGGYPPTYGLAFATEYWQYLVA